MGLRVDSELMYKSLSKAKVIKMAKHTMSDVRTGRKKYKCIYHTEGVQTPERLRRPREDVSERVGLARTGLDGLASVEGRKRRVIITNGLEVSYCKYPRRGETKEGEKYIW